MDPKMSQVSQTGRKSPKFWNVNVVIGKNDYFRALFSEESQDF